MYYLEEINSIYKKLNNLQPTELYNEGWMLKLVLNHIEKHKIKKLDIKIPEGCIWFTEARLPSPFLYSPKNKKLNEGYTHSDGAIGKFKIGEGNKGELTLDSDSNYFCLLEAKIGSSLSKGIQNAPTYNQAARNIACLAEVLFRAGFNDLNKIDFSFYVLMPEKLYNKNEEIYINPNYDKTIELLKIKNIKEVITKRIEDYSGYNKINNTIEQLKNNLDFILSKQEKFKVISWESILIKLNSDYLNEFYYKCLYYN